MRYKAKEEIYNHKKLVDISDVYQKMNDLVNAICSTL